MPIGGMTLLELLLALGFAFVIGRVARKGLDTFVPAAAPEAAAHLPLATPGALGSVPIGGYFTCRELRALGYRSAKLLAVVGGERAPAVMSSGMVAPTQRDTLASMHAAGRVYGLELMRFIHKGVLLDLTRETLVFAETAAGTIGLLVNVRAGSVRQESVPRG